jgi:hypothetical protein
MTQPKLVVIETFFNRMDADLARSVLTAASIDSIVSPDDGGGAYAGVRALAVRLLVREEDVERAKNVLAATAELDPEE